MSVDKLVGRSNLLQFDPGRHIYYLPDRAFKPYLSVTQFIKKYEHEFDPFAVSMNCVKKPDSKYYGMDPNVVREEWRVNNLEISQLGTKTHEYAELSLKGQEIKPISMLKEKQYRGSWDSWWGLASDEMLNVYPEIKLFDETVELAGTCDFFAKKKNGKLFLADYKTSSNIDKTNQYKNFKRPLTHLPECNFYKYSLQLSIYRHFVESVLPEEVFEDKMHIIWIREDNYKIVEVDYMRMEVELLFEQRRKYLEERQ